jgi:hypothetical protein
VICLSINGSSLSFTYFFWISIFRSRLDFSDSEDSSSGEGAICYANITLLYVLNPYWTSFNLSCSYVISSLCLSNFSVIELLIAINFRKCYLSLFWSIFSKFMTFYYISSSLVYKESCVVYALKSLYFFSTSFSREPNFCFICSFYFSYSLLKSCKSDKIFIIFWI